MGMFGDGERGEGGKRMGSKEGEGKKGVGSSAATVGVSIGFSDS